MITIQCLNCKKSFDVFPSSLKQGRRFCSRRCRSSGKFNSRHNGGLKKIKKVCLQCKKEFFVAKRVSKLRPCKFCSRNCVSKARGTGRKDYVDNQGYKYLYRPNHPSCLYNGCIAEHRLVIEKCLGRYLKKDEIVHHKNHNRLDNRLENLMILTSSQHHILHHKERDWTGKNNPNYKHGLNVRERNE